LCSFSQWIANRQTGPLRDPVLIPSTTAQI
jgi:hypothetical protein